MPRINITFDYSLIVSRTGKYCKYGLDYSRMERPPQELSVDKIQSFSTTPKFNWMVMRVSYMESFSYYS